MGPETPDAEAQADSHLERLTLCLPDFEADSVAQVGDPGFKGCLQQYFASPESNAAERLVTLKAKLMTASTYDFWTLLMEEMCSITGSQCGFVAKRMLVDDENTAVEMPELGEPGSCLMGVAFYLNNGRDVNKLYRDYRYHAYGCPCAHMKHDKVFIIPERMSEFVPNIPNALPWKQSEAFIGIPLFSEGKCFAHFGMIWSSEGAKEKKLSWGYIEMFMHSLEDMILQRILEGRGFAKDATTQPVDSNQIIPLDAISASQSLKPYARSLSHELRTPMQGVIGMLDIMHSTVMDAIDNQRSEAVKTIFHELKTNIEMVQDSSKRAVEAADNVVHAYDLNMQMPDTSLGIDDTFIGDTGTSSVFSRASERPRIIVEGSGIPLSPTERKRSRDELDFHPGPPLKRLANATRGGLRQSYPEAAYETPSASTSTASMDTLLMGYPSPSHHLGATTPPSFPASAAGSEIFAAVLSPTHRHLVMRDFMHELVDEALRACHPVTKHTAITERGEIIKVQTESPRGEIGNMSIEVDIEPDVPDHIVAEQAHLQFALQKVVDNALKFTENGNISLSVKLARNSQLLEIRVTDTGCGMTEDSKAHLFKPHFQEDASISRMKDGLGLSLFNAKAHVRKNLGGDMTLERSVMEGPLKGSEFLIRLPLFAITDGVGPETPLLGTPIIRAQRLGSPMPTSKTMAESVTQPFTPKSASKRPSPTMPLLSPKTCKAPKKQGFNRDLAKEIPLTVMVAEDNSINRNILVGYLKKLGYSPENIIVAFDGVEAVKEYENSLLRPTAQHIDAILMDLWMPNMNGYVATEQILKIAKERGESLAVMAVTADITSESLERAKQTGMKGFMSKPYKVLDVERLLIEHFGVDVQCTQGSYSG